MAVRLVEAAEQGMVALLARRMDEGGVAAEAEQLLVHALAEADRGLGEADHQDRPGQIGRDQPGQVPRRRAHRRGADGQMPAEQLRDDQEGAPCVAPHREGAQLIERPQAARDVEMQRAARQRDGDGARRGRREGGAAHLSRAL